MSCPDVERLGSQGFTLRFFHALPVWVSASVERLIRASALASAVRDHFGIASRCRLPICSSWYELPLIGRHLSGSRLRVGIRTEMACDETLIGLERELPRRRGGRSLSGRSRRRGR